MKNHLSIGLRLLFAVFICISTFLTRAIPIAQALPDRAPLFDHPSPVLTDLYPAYKFIGDTAFTLHLIGTDFVDGALVRWNDSDLSTTYVSSTQLTASVPAANITSVGTMNITVLNPTPGGGISGTKQFTVFTAGTWTQVGSNVPDVYSLVADPFIPSTLYAGSVSYVRKSLGRINDWVSLPNGFGSPNVFTLIIDPSDQATLYAGTINGVYKTTDQGENWSILNQGLPVGQTRALVFDPNTPTTLFAGVNGYGIYKSIDGGTSWSLLSQGLPSNFFDLSIDPLTPSIHYAATSYGVFRSADAGLSWNLSFSGPAETLSIDPVTPTTIYLGGSWGIFKTINSGTNWSSVLNLPTKALVIDPLRPVSLYAGTNQGFFMSQNSGATWVNNNLGLTNTTILSLAIVAGTTPTIYAGVGGGGVWGYKVPHPKPTLSSLSPSTVFVGDPAFSLTVSGTNFVSGASIIWGSTPLPTTFLSATQIQASIPIDLLQSASNVPITVSNPLPNSGISNGLTLVVRPSGQWVALWNTSGVRALAADTLSPSSLYAGTDFGSLSVSKDGGSSWRNLWGGNPIHRILVHPAVQSTLYMATYGYYVQRSTNSGTSWSWLYNGLSSSIVYALAIDPNTPDILYAGTNSGLYITTNGGTDWLRSANGFWGSDIRSLVIVPSAPSTVYAGTYGNGINKTTNGGASWTQVNNGLGSSQVIALVVDPLSPSTLYAGTQNAGIYKSTNGGANWAPVNSGLGSVQVNAITFDPVTPTNVYIATNVGIFKSANAGASWMAMNNGLNTFVCYTLLFDPVIKTRLYVGNAYGVSAIQIPNSAPTLATIDPSSTQAGAAPFTLTVTGNNFTGSSVVRWDTTDLVTTFVSPAQLTAVVPADLLTLAGQMAITVRTPAPGGGTSAALPMTIQNPVPVLTLLEPALRLTGSPDFTLTLTGSNFVSGSIVQWGEITLTPSAVSPTQITVTVPTALQTTAQTIEIRVVNPAPGGGSSAPQPLVMENPVPVLTGLDPASFLSGGNGFTLTATGSRFVSGAEITWNGSALPTTFVDGTLLTAEVPADQIEQAGTAEIRVVNPAPGGGTSDPQTFTMHNPLPELGTLSPNQKTMGDATFTLTVNGRDFTPASTIFWGDTPLSTTWISNTQLQAEIAMEHLTEAGIVQIFVETPQPGGGKSAPQPFTINYPIPELINLSPTSQLAGGPELTLTVTGAHFVSNSVVQWNTILLTTTLVSPTQLTATIPADQLADAGSAQISVVNPTPGGGTSSSQPFTILNPLPAITQISPASAARGSNGLLMTVTGTNFVDSSIVQWEGIALTTDRVSATQLQATVPADRFTQAGSVSVTVFNPTPGGGTSAGQTFTVENLPPLLTQLSPSSCKVGSSEFTLTVEGLNFGPGTVIQWDGDDLATVVVSDTQLTAEIAADLLVHAKAVQVAIQNPAPGGGVSNLLSFVVNNEAPELQTIYPNQALAGSTGLTLEVQGARFVNGATIDWDHIPLSTTFISPTQLTAEISAAQLANAGTVVVTVENPGPGGGTSGGQTFTLNNPVPVLDQLNPTHRLVGSTGFTLTVAGSGFRSDSVIRWDGIDLVTHFDSPDQLSAEIPANFLTVAKTAAIIVYTPLPGGGMSEPRSFQIEHPVPTLTAISPDHHPVGDPPIVLALTGTNFTPESVVFWGETPLSTTYLNSTQLSVAVGASLLKTPMVVQIRVVNPGPGGGTSADLEFVLDWRKIFLPMIRR